VFRSGRQGTASAGLSSPEVGWIDPPRIQTTRSDHLECPGAGADAHRHKPTSVVSQGQKLEDGRRRKIDTSHERLVFFLPASLWCAVCRRSAAAARRGGCIADTKQKAPGEDDAAAAGTRPCLARLRPGRLGSISAVLPRCRMSGSPGMVHRTHPPGWNRDPRPRSSREERDEILS
jgi:hypothetical protein